MWSVKEGVNGNLTACIRWSRLSTRGLNKYEGRLLLHHIIYLFPLKLFTRFLQKKNQDMIYWNGNKASRKRSHLRSFFFSSSAACQSLPLVSRNFANTVTWRARTSKPLIKSQTKTLIIRQNNNLLSPPSVTQSSPQTDTNSTSSSFSEVFMEPLWIIRWARRVIPAADWKQSHWAWKEQDT